MSRCSTICCSVVHSLPDSHFSLTIPNHLHLGLPLFRLPPSSFFQCSALLFSAYARTSSASYIGLPLRFIPLSLSRFLIISFLILSSFVTSHIHHSHLFYCAFCNVPAPILPLSCTASLGSSSSFYVTHPQIIFPFFQPFCTLRETSASSSPSSSNVDPRKLFECVHSLYCLFL